MRGRNQPRCRFPARKCRVWENTKPSRVVPTEKANRIIHRQAAMVTPMPPPAIFTPRSTGFKSHFEEAQRSPCPAARSAHIGSWDLENWIAVIDGLGQPLHRPRPRRLGLKWRRPEERSAPAAEASAPAAVDVMAPDKNCRLVAPLVEGVAQFFSFLQ